MHSYIQQLVCPLRSRPVVYPVCRTFAISAFRYDHLRVKPMTTAFFLIPTPTFRTIFCRSLTRLLSTFPCLVRPGNRCCLKFSQFIPVCSLQLALYQLFQQTVLCTLPLEGFLVKLKLHEQLLTSTGEFSGKPNTKRLKLILPIKTCMLNSLR